MFEEPAKPVPRRSSGSKRSRAAAVHNMSEKVDLRSSFFIFFMYLIGTLYLRSMVLVI